jgi:pseudouridine synthase
MENLYPMRINKYSTFKQISTRKGADILITKKQVFINGKLAVLGSKVNESDKVEVRGNQDFSKYKYFAYNKPIGTTTYSSEKEKALPTNSKAKTKDIKEEIVNKNIPKDVFPIGRLDKNSHGLIILTNDGRITDKLLNPKYVHEKEYLVKTTNKLRSNFKEKMEAGVNIEGYRTKQCKVQIVNTHSFKVILSEGKKHQIRRMCSALFQEIQDLKRIRVMNILLGQLKPNALREIKGKELETFLAQIFV